MSHSDDYFEKYGFMIEEDERREKAALTEQMRKWLLSGARLLCGYYNEVAESAAAIAPHDPQIVDLAHKTAMSELTAGMIGSGNWTFQTRHGGMVISSYTFTPYQQLFRVILECVDTPCDFDQVDVAVSSRRALYHAEAVLTDDRCGIFWQHLIDALPPYGDDVLFPDELFDLTAALAKCHSTLTSQSFHPWYDDWNNAFEHHWQVRSAPRAEAALRQRVFFPDRAAAEEAVRSKAPSECENADRDLLVAAFPQLTRLWTPQQLDELLVSDVLNRVAGDDPKLALQMFRLLLDTAEPQLDDPDAAEWYLGDILSALLETKWTGEQPIDLILDALRQDDHFAYQVFQSAYAGLEQQRLIQACIDRNDRALYQKLVDLLDESPWPHDGVEPDPWPEEEEEEKPRKRHSQRRWVPADPLPDDGTLFRYCTVKFPGKEHPYAYLTGDLPLIAGDWVEVPVGKQGASCPAQVQSLLLCTRKNAPWPPEKTRTVLRRCEAPDGRS